MSEIKLEEDVASSKLGKQNLNSLSFMMYFRGSGSVLGP